MASERLSASPPGTRLLLPHPKRVRMGRPVGTRGHPVATRTKVAVDRPVSREKALRLAGRLEPLHLALAATRRPMRVLGTIVQISALPMLDTGQDLALRGSIRSELVGHDHSGHIAQALEQLLEEALRCLGVAPALNQDVEDLAILVHGTPEIVYLAADADEDLVQMPLVTRTRSPPAQLVGEGLAELEAPAADALVGDDDAALGQDQLHVAQAQV